MLWRGREGSGNVEDGRGGGGGKALFGGGIGAAVLGLIVYLLGGDPSKVINPGSDSASPTETTAPANDSAKEFVSVVLRETEKVWETVFQEKYHESYQAPKLRLFTGTVQSGCGGASRSAGPFYCPLDQKVYIDLSFYDELQNRFNAPGDFAMAYVVAHEVGHHVQNLLGISEKVQRQRQQSSEAESNALSVRLELQADFLAGVWAHYAQNMEGIIEPGDIQEAMGAAAAVGDDRLQQEGQGYVVPDAFTHGSSAQRMYWFKKGYQSGNIDDGDTFSADL